MPKNLVSFRLEPSDEKKLYQIAKSSGLSVPEVLRIAVSRLGEAELFAELAKSGTEQTLRGATGLIQLAKSGSAEERYRALEYLRMMGEAGQSVEKSQAAAFNDPTSGDMRRYTQELAITKARYPHLTSDDLADLTELVDD